MIDADGIMILTRILTQNTAYKKAAAQKYQATAFSLFCFFQLAVHRLNAVRDDIRPRRPHALGAFIQQRKLPFG